MAMADNPTTRPSATHCIIPADAQPLRFGIPSLDELISGDPVNLGIGVSHGSQFQDDVSSICIIGPDGTGKSVLALHLASHYAADCYQKNSHAPRILYVSTDLRYEKAHRVWLNFMLNNPLKRPVPFFDCQPRDQPVMFQECVPGACRKTSQITLEDYLFNGEVADGKPVIAFVNLAAYTAGDDWGYLNHALATLDKRYPDAAHDMVILDAVEGLETLVGEQDAYGETRSRRARIAQFVRAASEKCHTALIVEEEREDVRQAEDYVTDVVIRLRTVETRDKRRAYVRRTVEIEKGRAQRHARGQHPFTIRGGGGSTTGEHPNPDDPDIVHPDDSSRQIEPGQTDTRRRLSYVHVFHSLDFLNRQIMETKGKRISGACTDKFAGFGIDGLDEMLAFKPDGAGGFKRVSLEYPESDDKGLPCSSTTALIGETGTHKNRLANAFLSRCFASSERSQVAVLITTSDVDMDGLVDKMAEHLKPRHVSDEQKAEMKRRIVCRRLEVHDISSAAMFHIVREAIWKAREILGGRRTDKTEVRHAQGNQIRLVIGNLALMASTYADVEDDSGFLPALLFYLGREGVTSLLVHTEEGGPNSPQISDFTRSLRNGVQHHLYTWHVPFYGEDRIAIAAQPPISDNNPAVVRELYCDEDEKGIKDDERLAVDPHFEIYTGLLEKQMPRLVPLSVRLWGGAGRFQAYREHMDRLFKELFHDMRLQGDIVTAAPKEEYENLVSFNNLQGATRLESTMVMQVDEFWTQNYSGLLRLESYLKQETVDKDGNPVRTNDPYRLFQLTERVPDHTGCKKRHQFYTPTGYKYEKTEGRNYVVDRVPYTWDFGFLLLRESVWSRAFDRQFKCTYPLSSTENNFEDGTPRLVKVCEIWNRLTHATPRSAPTCQDDGVPVSVDAVTWREFLHACTVVARSQGAEDAGYPYPFDIDMLAPESFSCLVLEIWASEIYRWNGYGQNVFRILRHEDSGDGLIHLLQKYKKELYRAWLLLGEVFSPAQFRSDGLSFEARSFHADAVASRHWYSTASHAQEARDIHDPLFPVRLPGNYSVRGDWYLAIARGSRSPRLGERAIDLLSSRRSNVMRLQEGIGLPTRDFIDLGTGDHVWTKLYTVGEYGNREPVTYESLKRIGSNLDNEYVGSTQTPKETIAEAIVSSGGRSTGIQGIHPDEAFYWLWRYTLRGYDRQARMFLKMQSRILFNWRKWMEMDGRRHADEERSGEAIVDWRTGFEAYDKLDASRNYQRYQGYREFEAEVDLWIDGLKSSTLKGW